MGSIHLLEDSVINKIAAGEVVERPASVLKELIENAIDAGATKLSVSLEEGGKKLISVSDNGSGMDEDDVRLSIKRHATSKISKADDLFCIKTMGFRGEALAAISSISRFTMTTAKVQAKQNTQKYQSPTPNPTIRIDIEEGLKLFIEGGNTPTISPWRGLPGTTVTVENLFFNVPARSKFLKSDTTEYAYCLELIQALSLGMPHVEFTLTHNGKDQFRTTTLNETRRSDFPCGETILRHRLSSILGKEVVKDMIYTVATKAGKEQVGLTRYGEIELLCSPPGIEKSNSKFVFIFINGRWVKDNSTRYAVLRGYQNHLLKGRYPAAAIFLKTDPSLVDVNVHPAKTEVRFQYAKEIQDLITFSIRNKLREGDWVKVEETVRSDVESHFSIPTSRNFDLESEARTSSYEVSSDTPFYKEPKRSVMSFDAPAPDYSFSSTLSTPANIFPPQNESIVSKGRFNWKALSFKGTFDNCYLIFESKRNEDCPLGTGMLVVDQHAFHERILFEELVNHVDEKIPSQALLIPEAMSLSPSEIGLLGEHKELLHKIGFHFTVTERTREDSLGEKQTFTSLEISAIPTLLTGKNIEAALSSIVESLSAEKESIKTSDILHGILSTIACHAAVRSGEELGDNELKQLLSAAEKVDFYLNCPHGRRVFKWWNKNDVAGWFDRV